MRLSIRTQALLLSIIPLAMLALVFALAVVRAGHAQEVSYYGRHSQDVLAMSSALNIDATDANRAIGDYGKTRAPAALGAFNGAIAKLVKDAARLQNLVADNPAQFARAKHLSALINSFLPVYRDYALAANDPAKQKAISESKNVQDIGKEYTRTQLAFDAAERQLAIDRFRMFSEQGQKFLQELVIAVGAGIILTVVSMLLFGRQIVDRLHRLADNAALLAAGKDPHPLEGGDEISALDAQYRDITMRMRAEHTISSQLQRALLPQQLPNIPGVRIDASYRPAPSGMEVGGDWYDVFVLDNRTIGVSLGDVSGHGLRAASTMALVRQSIQTAARYSNDATAVMELVNRTACDGEMPVVSAFFGMLDTLDGTLQYAVAGHPAPITVRASGTVGMLAGSGLLLGVERNSRYEKFETQLESGSALVLYTDGLVEMYRGDYSRGTTALIDAINAEYYKASENIAESIQNRVFANVPPHDDSAIVFIGITKLGASSASRARTWQVDANAISEARRLKRAFLWHLGQYTDVESDLTTVELILGELLGNVARHTAGRATVTLEIEGNRAVLHVADTGAPIERKESSDIYDESGRGLFLVDALSRRLQIARHETGNHISAELPVDIAI